MIVWKLKGRNELTGYVSGTMYLIEDKDVCYYYLINILDPKDIRIINNPSHSSKKLLQLDSNDIPKELVDFHSMRISSKNLSSKEISAKIQEKKLEQLKDYWVHDLKTTKYVISQIGKVYHNVSLEFNTRRLVIYILDGVWKVKIDKTSLPVHYSIIRIEDEKAEFAKKTKTLMAKTDLPWEICKLLVNDIPEEKALIVLNQIKKDRMVALDCYFFNYFSSLCHRTNVVELLNLPYRKQKQIYEYMYRL